MTPAQLQRAVARATGEDLAVIATRGFSLVTDETPSEDDIPGQVVDWAPPFSGSDVPAWAAEYDHCVQPEPLFAEPTDEVFADSFAENFADWPGTAQSARRHRPITRRQTRSLIPPALPHVMEPAFDDPADDLNDDNHATAD